MKDLEGFRASVYARAEARRAKIRERNRKIRGAALGAAMVALVMAATAPAVRNGRIFVGVEQPIVTQDHSNAPMSQPQKEAPPARVVLLMGTPDGGEAEVVVLDSSAKQIAFVDRYKADNNMPEEEDPVLTPVLDSAAKTLHSKEELEAFLRLLPKTSNSIQQVISEYDEEFFANNDLCAMPLDVMPAAMGAEETPEPNGEGVTEPYSNETEPETNPDTGPAAEPETGMTQAEDQSRPPPPSTTPEESMLPENGVQMLLLVPTNKG